MSAPLAAPARVAAATRRPARVVDVELAHPLEPLAEELPDARRYTEAWLVVRLFEEPVGLVRVPVADGGAPVAVQAAAITAACGSLVTDRARAAGVPPERVLAGAGAGPGATGEPPFAHRHQRVRAEGPEITVVLCTRDRPADLDRALASLRRQSYERFRVLVVDNAPGDERTATLVAGYADAPWPVEYVREPRPGLSWARNRALRVAGTPVVAWLDDDEEADRHWVMELARAFVETPAAAAVSGAVVPAELETLPQLWFEQYGGHTKGRGFEPAEFAGRRPAGQSALYPLPSFGVGANMAFRTDALRALGGFDPALGAGTRTLGGEDTLIFSRLLLAGELVLYRPSALTRHYHRPDYDSLARQMTGYGVGLTAYYAALLRTDWRLVAPLLRLAPRALYDTFGRGGNRLAGLPASFPPELLRRKTRGMLTGPIAYARARRTARALAGERT